MTTRRTTALLQEHNYSKLLEWTSLWGLRLFLLLVVTISLRRVVFLFLQRHGWSHRVAGGALLAWLALGVCMIPTVTEPLFWFEYDVILGLLGITATLTAAHDFPHKHVKNAPGQSGTLEKAAIVTQSEMVEHSFYQGLNLVQALYLHIMGYHQWENAYIRLFALYLVTSPWHFRKCFPVHSFSNNWKQASSSKQWNIEILLYQIKKWQYVFYKHAVFHGINISVALRGVHGTTGNNKQQQLVTSTSWRIFWLALNASYVMEFFLQSLVKRGVLTQNQMLWLQRLLMTASSLAAAVAVLPHLQFGSCLVSVLLNFYHRGHDVDNTMLLATLVMMLSCE